MSERIKLTASELEGSSRRFKNYSQEVDNILRSCDSAVSTLDKFWEGSSAGSFIWEYRNARKVLSGFPGDILKFSQQLDYVAKTMQEQDRKLSNGIKKNKSQNSINADNYSEGGESPFDIAVGSKITSALVAGIDKKIGLDIESVVGKGKKVSPNEVSTNLKNLGFDHSYRRGFLRDIPKDVRDVEVDIPGVLKLGKGLGILTVGLTGLSVADDIKNNKTVAQKVEASGVDIGMTGAAYVGGNVLVGLVGGACAVAAAPEIVTVGAVVVTVGLVGVGANWATNKIKGLLHLW